ncbi:YeeE/YedE thiosulfate transporter family protein [Enterovibrio norvegicus]|uniref:YeeE/YedE thiosulfate transporter family protein n=1 Tax=Enterovibrio norvegicus TaxID=188144 RepID=A0ABV4L4V9_9GAMM
MVLALAMVCIFFIGYLSQTAGLCMVRGVKQAKAGTPFFLLAIISSGTFAWVLMASGHYFVDIEPQSGLYPSIYSFVGGLLFGLGAAANGGCGVSTVSRFARGESPMIMTILGWIIAWLALEPLIPQAIVSKPINLSSALHYGTLTLLSMFVVCCLFFVNPERRKLWLSILGIGLLGGLVFLYEPHWTPSGLLRSMSLSVWHGDNEKWPEATRFVLVAILILGMFVAAKLTGSFLLRGIAFRSAAKHLAAGCLMGIGAVMAKGGNDSQLLVAMPSLSLNGFAAVLSMVVGIYIGLKLLERG